MPKESDEQQHARQLREAEKTSHILVKRELRNLREYLKKLTQDTAIAIRLLDDEMKKPSDSGRGSRIAKITNALEMSKDMAVRFGLRR